MKRTIGGFGVALFLVAEAALATTGAVDKETTSKQPGWWTIYVEESTSGSFTILVYINGVFQWSDTDSQSTSYTIRLYAGDYIEVYLSSTSGDYDLELLDPNGVLVDSSREYPSDEPDYVSAYVHSVSSSSGPCGGAAGPAGLSALVPLAVVMLASRRRRAV